MPANILNLPQYRVLRVEETNHDYHVTAAPLELAVGLVAAILDGGRAWTAS